MPGNERLIGLLRTHKRWADRYSLVSVGLLVALSIAVVIVGQTGGVEPQTVTQMVVLICAIVVVVTVWQGSRNGRRALGPTALRGEGLKA